MAVPRRHMDSKSRNGVVGQFDSGRLVRLSDFGAATALTILPFLSSTEGRTQMALRMRTALLTATLLVAVIAQRHALAQSVDVTGTWDVTITTPNGSVSELAILSQDATQIVGMLGPAVT